MSCPRLRSLAPVVSVAFVAAFVAASCGSLPLERPRDGGGGGGGGPGGRHHPLGWALPEQHGAGLKRQSEDCRNCHGDDLRGGGSAPVGCDGCHAEGWRTSCTYCHGDAANGSGAPPRGLFEADPSRLAFPAHTVHVTDTATHRAFDCTTCHAKPSDVLSPGHVFDDTPAVADVVLRGGLSPAGTWQAGACNDLYCHGNGRSNGSVHATDGPRDCGGCHARAPNGGKHEKHRQEGIACHECHGDTVNQRGDGIVNVDLHVNGRIDLRFSTPLMVFSGGRCTGTCHTEGHLAEEW